MEKQRGKTLRTIGKVFMRKRERKLDYLLPTTIFYRDWEEEEKVFLKFKSLEER